jgi:6-phosphogluconate dehydrogenase
MKILSKDLTKLVSDSLESGYPIPLFSSCLNYFLSFTQANSASNLIQAQRNYFGNHTLELK